MGDALTAETLTKAIDRLKNHNYKQDRYYLLYRTEQEKQLFYQLYGDAVDYIKIEVYQIKRK